MEYQQKKEQILGAVEFTNLLSFNLVQNKLERNFKAIVEAVLLNQTKTDDLASKSQQLEDRLALERQKSLQEQEGFKQALRQLNERMNKLQINPVMMGQNGKSMHRDESKKQLKQSSRIGSSKKQIPADVKSTSPSDIGSSIVDKKFEDVMHQIEILKDKMPGLQLMESQFDNMKRELAMFKAQLMNVGSNNRSNKSIKRQSIGNAIRGDNFNKMGRNSVLSHSSSSVLLQQTDKENKSAMLEPKEPLNKLETHASSGQQSADFEREMQGMRVEVNTLHLFFDELKVMVDDLRKKDIKAHSTLSQVEDRQKKIVDEMRKDTQNFEKQIKNIQLELMNNSNQNESVTVVQEPKTKNGVESSNRRASNNSNQMDENNMNFKNQLNDRLSKIQASLQGFITEGEFNRFKAESRGKTQEIEKKHEKLVNQYEEQIKKIYDLLINKDLDINRLGELIAANTEMMKQNSAQADRKHNIAIARADQLKKGLQNLREDVEFYQSLNAEKEKKSTEGEKKNQGDQQTKEDDKTKGLVEAKALEELKKYFNNKLHDQRAYLIGLVRDLQKKQQASGGVNQEIANIWDKINEFTLFLGKKADAQDTKKNLIYLQKKINRLNSHLIKSQDNSQDATIARKNWFCLSCDKNLLGYQGKVGSHVVWDSMPLKGMVKNIDKRGLPSLKSK